MEYSRHLKSIHRKVITKMKLTEAVQFRQPLFESFKDLKGIIERELDETEDENEVDVMEVTVEAFEKEFNHMQDTEGGLSQSLSLFDTKGLVNAVKYVIQHDLSEISLEDVMRKTKNSRMARTIEILDIVTSEAVKIIDKLEQPHREEPDYETVDKGNNYTVYKLNNYTSARKICNAFGTTHCIGSSDTTLFYYYGLESDRNTFAIATSNKRLVIVHSGSDGFLITPHDNHSEVTDKESRGGGVDVMFDDLMPPLDEEEVRDILLNLIDSKYHRRVNDMLEEYLADL